MPKKRWLYVAIIGLFGGGLILRLYNIGVVSYWMDEAFSITLAQAIVQHGYPLLDSGQIIWRDPIYHYLLALSTAVGGISEISTRIISVMAGMGSVVLLGYIAQQWFGPKVGLITLALMSLSYWEITWSRQARMYMLFQLLGWITLFLLEQYKKNSKLFFIWIIVSVIITIFTHRLGIIVISLGIIFLAAQKHIKNIFLHSSLIVGLVLVSAVASRLYYGHWVNYWLHYWQYLLLQYPVTLFFAGLGVGLLFYKQHRLVWWLASICIAYLGILSYAVPLVQYRYLFVIWPIILIWAACGINQIVQYWKYSLIVIIIVLGLSREYLFWPTTQLVLESDASTSALPYKSFTPQPDFKAAYGEIQKTNLANLITPYPAMTRLYLGHDDTAAIPLDLTGTTLPKTTQEVYTGVEYITLDRLQQWQRDKIEGIILLDTFSQHRIEPALREYIEDNLEPVYEQTAGPWSTAQLYKF